MDGRGSVGKSWIFKLLFSKIILLVYAFTAPKPVDRIKFTEECFAYHLSCRKTPQPYVLIASKASGVQSTGLNLPTAIFGESHRSLQGVDLCTHKQRTCVLGLNSSIT